MEDGWKLIIILYLCMVPLIYFASKSYGLNPFTDEPLLFECIPIVIISVILLLSLRWYQKKHPEEFYKLGEQVK